MLGQPERQANRGGADAVVADRLAVDLQCTFAKLATDTDAQIDTRVSICASVAANEAALVAKATIARPVVAKAILISINSLYVNKVSGVGPDRKAIADRGSVGEPRPGSTHHQQYCHEIARSVRQRTQGELREVAGCAYVRIRTQLFAVDVESDDGDWQAD